METHYSKKLQSLLLFAMVIMVITLIGCGGGEQQTKKDMSDTGEMPAVPSMKKALDAKKMEFDKNTPEETKKIYNEGIEAVGNSGVLETAKMTGDTAPMFSLPSATGDTVALKSLLDQGPVILTWYRGGWCPYCNIQLNLLQESLPTFDKHNATLVAISPEVPDSSLSTKEKNELDFIVLSDVGNEVAREYGIVYTLPASVKAQFEGRLDIPAYNADDSWELPLAVTYVVSPTGVIEYHFVEPDYRQRAEPSEIIATLKMMSAEHEVH